VPSPHVAIGYATIAQSFAIEDGRIDRAGRDARIGLNIDEDMKIGCMSAFVVLATTLAGCGGEGDGTGTNETAAEPAAVTIKVAHNKFQPETATIKPGQIVEWVFEHGSHDVVSGAKGADGACTPDGRFGSGLQSSGTFRHKFTSAGDFKYFCTPHCDLNMVGKVVVK